MTDYSRIEMAFELYKEMINRDNYSLIKYEEVDTWFTGKTAKIAFGLADVFIEEIKRQGDKQ